MAKFRMNVFSINDVSFNSKNNSQEDSHENLRNPMKIDYNFYNNKGRKYVAGNGQV